MTNTWTERWNERYANDGYAYGQEPNIYFKEKLKELPLGKILLPAEGEGRNAVFAAKQGWEVSAFDISIEGQRKARNLAKEHNVVIEYQVGELEDLSYKEEQFDAIALIFAHFPANIKLQMHKSLDKYLKIGGTVIFEAFSKNHIDYKRMNEKVGGPGDLDSLFSEAEILNYFDNYKIIELEEKVIQLQEGTFHNGQGSVIRFVGRKQ